MINKSNFKLFFYVSVIVLFCNNAMAQKGYELAYQETFEAPIGGPWKSAMTSWDATESVSPTHSLKYTKTNPADSNLLGPDVNFTPGQSCYASVMVKTSNLSSGKGGVKIGIEAYGTNGYISGQYSTAYKSTKWAEIKTPMYTIPPTATRVKVFVYIDKDCVGTAWFDDFKFFAEPSKPLASKMVTPSYRGILLDNEYDKIELSTKLLTNAANYFTQVKLLDANNQIVGTQTAGVGQTAFTASFPTKELSSGNYKVIAEVYDKNTNQLVESNSYVVKKLATTDAKPKNYVDKYGRLIVDGKPYFVLGAYYGTLTNAVINDTKNSPLNTVISYQYKSTSKVAVLEKLNAAGIKTLFSLKDFYKGAETDSITKYVNLLKNHPAILGWYTNDENNIGLYKQQMLDHQTLVESLDYNHPTYSVDLSLPSGEFFTKATDIFGTDLYPVHNDVSAVSNPGEWTKFVKSELPHRAPMTVIQSFAWGDKNDRLPTISEMRSMSWQAIAEGATGLMYYAYFEIANNPTAWANLKQVGQEIKELSPVILSVEQTPKVDIAGGGSWMNWTVRKYNNKVYVIAVNNKKERYQKIGFSIPNVQSVKVLNENRTLPVIEGSFTDSFDSLAVHIYEVTINK